MFKREDLGRGATDSSDVATDRLLPPVHPGEILRDEFLKPLAIGAFRLAQGLMIPRTRLNDIVLGRRGITAGTALRLVRYLGTTPDYWVNLQARHDMDVAERTLRLEIEKEIEPNASDPAPVPVNLVRAA